MSVGSSFVYMSPMLLFEAPFMYIFSALKVIVRFVYMSALRGQLNIKIEFDSKRNSPV
jgi:hypothetical protein